MFTKYGGRVSEPEVKFIFLVLCFLGALAVTASSEAVLPAYLFGLVIAGVFVQDKVLIHRMRTITFTLLDPLLFHQGRGLDLYTSPGRRLRAHCSPACGQNSYQSDRGVAVNPGLSDDRIEKATISPC